VSEARKTTRLRAALAARDGVTVAPGVYDALSARALEASGFGALSVTGAGMSASLGYPDVGLLTQTEVAARIKSIADATTVPVLADADTGYGNVVNVVRTIREFEAAGAAGIHIEDQVTPKKCGQLAGKELIPAGEMVQKVEAALEARRDPDFVIVARTDARGVDGLAEAIDRARQFAAAGADATMIYGPESRDELAAIAEQVPSPLIGHISVGGKLAGVSAADFEALGFAFVMFPLQAVLATTHALLELGRAMRSTPDADLFAGRMIGSRELYDLVGLGQVEELESRYAQDLSENVGGIA
jgi:2-methylisocitrate lyase-like PEP mutase family enzyme